jgi:outer membrane biosynthesis protein TonB
MNVVGVKKGDEKVEASKEGGDSEGGAEVGAEADAMDVDVEGESLVKEAQRTPVVEVEDSEPEEDGAAMQIEMEMRGPRSPKANNKTPAASPKVPVAASSKPAPAPAPAPAAAPAPAPAAAPAPVANHRPTRSSTGGFTAINGK